MISAWWLLLMIPVSVLSYLAGLLVHNMTLAVRAGCSFLRAFVYAVDEFEKNEKCMVEFTKEIIGVKK